ncbi:hypothetical protein HK099_000343 [Clydaea vesicula]|uniref:Uncharacterized protein n=1 Tax=Clydaea vesicula TaxID=447962 RepID=A0AAD5TUS1_9FUNG|nr:hypothetical protein HK099_000343 [Clydaea vesicula]
MPNQYGYPTKQDLILNPNSNKRTTQELKPTKNSILNSLKKVSPNNDYTEQNLKTWLKSKTVRHETYHILIIVGELVGFLENARF